MNAFNAASSALFDRILAPFGHGAAAFDLIVWPVLAGVVALLVYKAVSDQKGIEAAKDRIRMHLLEIRLFRNDLRVVFSATGRILVRNAIYVGHSLLPMVVLIVPFMAVLAQIEANYAFAPAPVGSVEVLRVEMSEGREAITRKVEIEIPEGVVLDAPPVRSPDGVIWWRLRAEAAGDHIIRLVSGSEVFEKRWAVGGEPRKVPVLRTRGWEALLYPGEPGIPEGSAFASAAIRYPVREMPWLPDGELGVLAWFFGLSLLAGFALKDLFGVTL